MKKIALVASLLAGLMAGVSPAANAQEVYWTTSGTFGPFNIQGLIPTYPTAKDITIPRVHVDHQAPDQRRCCV